MSKRLKKQYGITQDKEDEFRDMREAKKTGKSRLDQVLEKQELNKNTANEDSEIMQIEEDDFIVDDYGNPVNYESDNEENNEDDNDDNQTAGPMGKLIKNMTIANQNKKVVKGIDSKTVKNKAKIIQNLIDEIDDEDDNDNSKNQSDLNQPYLEEYQAPYLSNNNISDDDNQKMDIDTDTIKEEVIKTKPKQRQIASVNPTNVDDYNSDNISPIKRRKEISKDNNILKTANVNEENGASITTMKRRVIQTEYKPNGNDINNTENKNNLSLRKPNTHDPLPTNQDKSVYMYWYDAIEENIQNKPCVIFFGKVYDPKKGNYYSISLIIKSITRVLYVLPKVDYQEGRIMEVYEEFNKLRSTKFNYIKSFNSKPTSKKYCFELPIDHNKDQQVLEVTYCADYGTIPLNLTGNTFDYIFGRTTSLLEQILLHLRIKGPCWLKVSNYEYGNSFTSTWTKYELIIKDYKNLQIAPQVNIPEPPLRVLAFSTKSVPVRSGNELICIACALKEKYLMKDEKGENNINNFTPLVFCRNIDNKLPYMDTRTNPPNILINQNNLKNLFGEGNLLPSINETVMLNQFINKVYMFDPDIIVGHNLYSNHLELLIERITKNKLNNWSKLTHFKREMLPKFMQNTNYSNDRIRSCFAGRLICDTFMSTREMLLKETNYDLKYLVEKYFNGKLDDINIVNLLSTFTNVQEIADMLKNTLDEAFFSFAVMDKYQIIPLTKQLTKIAGNVWIKSLQCSRASRSEMLLLHRFYEKGYLLPDKNHKISAEDSIINNNEEDDDDDEGEKRNRGRRGKPKYSGGLVLEPEPGLYSDIVLLLDFNSLYPSIIQEYNICFTTVIRKPTHSFNQGINKNDKKGKNNKDADDDISENYENDKNNEAEEHIDLREKIKEIESGNAILPNILKELVEERRKVKNIQKKETDKFKYSLLEIKQKALKVTANSLYGYLGYKNSRFYAKDIAALITSTGRRILKNAAMIVETKGNKKVIYGDTDSVMINTSIQKVSEAVELGNDLKKKINHQYKLLEMDIDGLFKSLLLLKKKKYAALKYIPPFNDNSKIEREIKGLDLVRRDWCPLAKNVGSKILDILLSGKSKDDIINDVYDELRITQKSIEAKQIALKDYAITKQLAKNVEDYTDIKALPHVAVAKRLKKAGDINIKASYYIPYIVCLAKDQQKIKSISDRCYHPKEIEADTSLIIDTDWYKENQILSIIFRLVHHIEDIDKNVMCDCLGVKNRHEYRNTNDNQTVETTSVTKGHFKVREGINIKCIYCENETKINEFHSKLDCIQKLTTCPKCKKINKNYNSICNSIESGIKRIVFNYYKGKNICFKCRDDKNALFFRKKCPEKGCNGILQREWDELSCAEELNFLKEMTDGSESRLNKDEINNNIVKEFNKATRKVHEIIDKIYNNIGYYKLNLGELFEFLKHK